MSRHFLITAFPPTPESCRQALALPSTTRTRRIRLRVCLSLLLCAVLLGGIACAAAAMGCSAFCWAMRSQVTRCEACRRRLGNPLQRIIFKSR